MSAIRKLELEAMKARHQRAQALILDSTWPQRAQTYGPVVAQAVLASWNDVRLLLEDISGNVR